MLPGPANVYKQYFKKLFKSSLIALQYIKFSNEASQKAHFAHNFRVEEEQVILERLNMLEVSELNRYAINSARAKKILNHRKKIGPFKNLQEVLLVDGFSVKILASLCHSILNPLTADPPERKLKNYNYVTPDVTTEVIKDMKYAVGVAIGTLSVSWSAIEVGNNNILNWQHHVLPLSPEVKKYHETQILSAAYDAFKHIPKADCYVMESFSTGSPMQSNGALTQLRQQLSSMLLVLLNREHEEQSRVFFQRNALWCRLYSTLVGSERVSTEGIVEDMLGNAPGLYTPLQVPNDIVERYYSCSPVVRQIMNSALLITTSFLDVNVRKNQECLDFLRGRMKKT